MTDLCVTHDTFPLLLRACKSLGRGSLRRRCCLNKASLLPGLRCEWNANIDDGPTHRFRSNINNSVYQPNALLHARETETSALRCRFQVEPSSQITDKEMNLTLVFPQFHLNPFDPAVFGCIVQSFL
jgi:hypothetical protein